MEVKRAIATAIVIVTSISCSSAAQPLASLVPEDALELTTREAEQQMDFKLVRPANAGSISERGLKDLRSAGWRYCTADQWDTFSESVDNTSRRVMQRVSYLRKQSQAIAILERYLEVPARDHSAPRYVTLVHRTLGESEIDSIIATNRLKCS